MKQISNEAQKIVDSFRWKIAIDEEAGMHLMAVEISEVKTILDELDKLRAANA